MTRTPSTSSARPGKRKERGGRGGRRSAGRHVVFVTGSRAELGLMLRTLDAVRAHPALRLSVVATGMHVDGSQGAPLAAFAPLGWGPDAVVPWPATTGPAALAEATGAAVAGLAKKFGELRADVVLVVGDRVEAFAAAAAAHIARIPLAHVHGGDVAEGQVDDALRHAITQLAHLHFVASSDARDRVIRLGQPARSVKLVGAPGAEGIASLAGLPTGKFPDLERSAVVLLHPAVPDDAAEYRRARGVLKGVLKGVLRGGGGAAGVERVVCLSPNNDPGSEGIRRAWREAGAKPGAGVSVVSDLPRGEFLGLLRDGLVLVGNSSAGILEAGSFGTPVVNIGPRQGGRLRGVNVTDVGYDVADIARAVRRKVAAGRCRPANPYARPRTAERIAAALAATQLRYPAPPKRLSH